MDLNRQLDEDVLVAEGGFLDTVRCWSVEVPHHTDSALYGRMKTHLSVVNFPSLYAAINPALNLYALRLSVPALLLLTSKTSATHFSPSPAFWKKNWFSTKF